MVGSRKDEEEPGGPQIITDLYFGVTTAVSWCDNLMPPKRCISAASADTLSSQLHQQSSAVGLPTIVAMQGTVHD
jgi:hypothetical protein